MFDSLFELLFRHSPLVFQQGEFRFALSRTAYVAAVTVGAGAASTLLTYRIVRGGADWRDRVVLVAIRLAAIVLVLFCLARPVLVVKAAVPGQNFVGVLLDDSRSMRIADAGGRPRSAFVAAELDPESGALLARLSDRFAVRLFRFAASADRVRSVRELRFDGAQTRLTDALWRAREELAGLPLAGLVLVTDGADTTQSAVTDAIGALKAEGVPVFTVGLGDESIDRDIQVSHVAIPRAVLKNTSLVVDVTLSHAGYGGATMPLDVESDGRIVSSQEVTLPGAREPATVRVRFTASEAGPQVFRFRVPPQPGELVAENNARDVLVEVEDRREKILYFEGEPRFEVKFLRRAVADDRNLQVVVLQRTAENKYLRLDVDHADELVAGFPTTREELFAYRGLVLGSIEAAAFTGDQLRMVSEFVDRRGGGLLMMGGPRAFAEGGYAGTPVADVLPVVLDRPARGSSPFFARLNVRPSRAGAAHPAVQIAATEQASAARWKDLPPVTSVNPTARVKPGATILLTGGDAQRREHVVLAYQRYGRGKSLAFTVQDSWLWQLHASVPVDDVTHERFWRQLLRWLVDGVPERVMVKAVPDRVDPGQDVTLVAEVTDGTYLDVNDARVVARVTAPSGRSTEVPMQWTGEGDGEYRGTFAPDEEGIHEVRTEAARAAATLGADVSFVRVAPGDEEYFDPAMRAPLLKRIATETGGRFYTPDRVASLPDDLRYTGRGVTTVEERELWDMPVLLVLLVGLLLGDWSYRRVRGLA